MLAPNLLLLAWPPRGPHPRPRVPWPFAWLERAGQALCLVVPAITAVGTPRVPWLLPALAALGAYYALWGRYFGRGRSWASLYAPLWVIPVPMAVFPVMCFLAAAVALQNWWMAAAAVVLACGHIPVSLLSRGPS